MENVDKRYFWVINLVVLAVLAWLTARVVNNVLAGQIAAVGTTPAPASAEPLPVIRGSADSSQQWARAIAERNLFNSEPPSDEPAEPEATDEPKGPTGEVPGPDDECKASEGNLSLLATMVALPTDQSMAVMDDGDSPDDRIVREGQQVGDAEVARIYRSRVVLSRGSGYECVEIGGKRRGGKTSSAYTPSTSYNAVASSDTGGAAAGGPDQKKIEQGIHQVGKDRYEVDREMLNEQLEDLGAISRQARVIPHYRDGKPQGFKIVGVRPGSLLSQLGVRSGDVLKTVNSEEIDSPNKALELFDRLKTTDNVVIEVDRRGQPATLEYQIK
jgi:general secretion pathway protein C